MLQIDHIYEFLYKEIFSDFELYCLKNGYPDINNLNRSDMLIFTPSLGTTNKIFFYDQEPLLEYLIEKYLEVFNYPEGYTIDQILELNKQKALPFGVASAPDSELEFYKNNPDLIYPKNKILVTSEKSKSTDRLSDKHNCHLLYYFFHGFAALDWYRGYYALNYNKNIVRNYKHDYISFNRIITEDRSYRIYFVSLLKKYGLLDKGLVSFNVTDNLFDDWRDEVADNETKLSEHARRHAEQHLTGIDKLIIDHEQLPGSASANILRNIKSNNRYSDMSDVEPFWHIVTETVFYHDKLHLTEKIFKPIVSKQPFMLLAAPGNLAYLRSYGFKTFDGIIDESYDLIEDNDARIDAVTAQLAWYCNLSQEEKQKVIERLAPIVEYNFHHFYGEFKHIITRELLDNCKAVFKEIGYDDSNIAYDKIKTLLLN